MPVPEGMSVGMVIGSGGCNIKQLRSIAECHIDVKKDRVKYIEINSGSCSILLFILGLDCNREPRKIANASC